MRGAWLRWGALTVVAGSTLLAVVLASRFGSDPGLVPSPLLGEPAPAFTLERLDGSGTVLLSGFAGDIVVINFFASWCLECRAEHADLLATAAAFGEGVTFVGISYQEERGASLAYLDEVGRWDGEYLADPGSRTAIAYGVFGIPETFFVDRSGVVVGKLIGEADALTLGGAIDAIMRGERPGQSVTGDTRQAP